MLQKPFSMNERNPDRKAESKLRMPHNPIGLTHNCKPLITFTQFCKNRNIPFNENEERYYLMK